MSFKKILVTLDLSPLASKVFEHALDLAQKEAAKLMLFHSINWETLGGTTSFIEGGTEWSFLGEVKENAENQVKELLQSYLQQATDKGIAAELNYNIGDPGESICDLAQTWGADLILIGRRGRQGLTEFFLGSVSSYVVHHASCSVLVIQQE